MTQDTIDNNLAYLLKQKKISLISMFGPDGAGKSTHVDLLVDYLNKNGVKVKKIWVRSPHTLAYLLWRLFIKLGKCRIETNHLGAQFHRPSLKGGLSKGAWALIELVSVLPHLLRASYLIRRGYVLVAERYVIDSVATIAYFIDDKSFINSHTARLLLRFLPPTTVLIFLDATYDVIAKRRKMITEPMTFIEMQRYAYHHYAKILGCNTIVTDDYSVPETHKKIVDIVSARLRT